VEPRPEGAQVARPAHREWTHQRNRRRGTSGQGHERKEPGRTRPAPPRASARGGDRFRRSRERSGGEAKVTRDGLSARGEVSTTGRPRGPGPVTVQGRGGSREVQRPATAVDAGGSQLPKQLRRRRP
jgi:hypothetical protein